MADLETKSPKRRALWLRWGIFGSVASLVLGYCVEAQGVAEGTDFADWIGWSFDEYGDPPGSPVLWLLAGFVIGALGITLRPQRPG